MRGKNPIVIAADNSRQFKEHVAIDMAKKEAERLCLRTGQTFIVYVPAVVVKPAPRTITEEMSEEDLRLLLNCEVPF